MSYSDAYAAVLYHFILMMQTHSFALWLLKTVRNITNIVLFFLLIPCPVQVLLLPAMKRAVRNLLHICKMFCSLKRAHKGSFLCTDITFLVRTVYNGLRFNEYLLLRTFDTDTRLLQS